MKEFHDAGPASALDAHATTLEAYFKAHPPRTTFSPQLNLIERLWRFVCKECLYPKYYPKFDGFKQAIADCLQTASTKHKAALRATPSQQAARMGQLHWIG